MPAFPFTFTFPIPFRNPFASPAQTTPSTPGAASNDATSTPTVHAAPPDALISPFRNLAAARGTLAPPALDRSKHLSAGAGGLKRSRGWSPYSAGIAASPSTSTTYASSSGYLDTPAKYRDLAHGIVEAGGEIEEEMIIGPSRSDRREKSRSSRERSWAGLDGYEAQSVGSTYRPRETQNEPDKDESARPAKRRRTNVGSGGASSWAGTIASTAVSAAIIGTAVGISVYRMWRDRGKPAEIESTSQEERERLPPEPRSPPPPYSPAATTPGRRKGHSRTGSSHTHSHSYSSPVKQRQKQRRRAKAAHLNSQYAALTSRGTGRGEEEGEDQQMDAISGAVERLIAEGRRALGRDIVLPSGADGDDDYGDDDMEEGWEEEDEETFDSARRSAPQGLGIAADRRFDFNTVHAGGEVSGQTLHVPPRTPNTISMPTTPVTPSFTSEFGGLQDDFPSASPELRESMQKARESVKARRGLGGVF